MSISWSDEEIEQDRLTAVDAGKNLRSKPTAEHWSQLMHLANFLEGSVESAFMDELEVTVTDPEAYKHAHNASTALYNLYQRYGELCVAEDEK